MDNDELHLSQIQRYDNVFDNMCLSCLGFAELSHPSEPCWMCGSQLRGITTMSEVFVCFALEVLQVLRKKKTVSPRAGFRDMEKRGLAFGFAYKLRKRALLRESLILFQKF